MFHGLSEYKIRFSSQQADLSIYPQMKIFIFCFKLFSLWAITRIPHHRQLMCNFREAEIVQILCRVKGMISHQSSPYSMDAYSKMHRHRLLTAKQRTKANQTFLESRFCGPVSAISHTWCWFYWLLLMPTVAHLTQVIDYHLMSIKFCTLLTFLYIGEIF